MKHALAMCFALLISSSVFAQSTGNETARSVRVSFERVPLVIRSKKIAT